MAHLNKRIAGNRPVVRTHEGGVAFQHLKPLDALKRSVMSCFLWEDEFYEDGKSIADRIGQLVREVKSPDAVANIAIDARTKHNLRHVPLLVTAHLAQTNRGEGSVVADVLTKVVNRADELTEFLAIYAKLNGVKPDKLKKKLSAQVKRGLARAFVKFDAYQLGKYNRDGAIKLRDVMFMVHPKPKDDAQAAMWERLADQKLESPDTWEVGLSAGKDKKETFERLLHEKKLGYMALLRNLRNMEQAGVDSQLVTDAIFARKGAERVLPFRYVAAARACPRYEPALDMALQASILEMPKLKGTTTVLVDVSGSMDAKLSSKSDLTRLDAAAVLASIIPGDVRVFTFSNNIVETPARKGMAGVDAIHRSQPHGGTYLGGAIEALKGHKGSQRLIVITDEQSHDGIGVGGRAPENFGRCYLINVASAKNGVGYGKSWTHIDGFSENVLKWLHEFEAQDYR